jgi:hypothetical protein
MIAPTAYLLNDATCSIAAQLLAKRVTFWVVISGCTCGA